MRIRNNTHYFDYTSRLYNYIPDTTSFAYESSVRNGFFQRLYFEHLYTKSVGGISLFYTLTYNDKSIPSFFGLPCFKYDDIRYVTNGALSKWLNRHYGARLRYFCACERGEGKGKRGLGNNPHYHFIFFVQPLSNSKVTYKCPTAFEFRDKIKEIWQGSSGYINFKEAKFGICQEGDNLGVIDSTNGCFSYVGKYVIKDSVEQSNLEHLEKHYRDEVVNVGITEQVYLDFFDYNKDVVIDDVLPVDEVGHLYSIDYYHRFQNYHPDVSIYDWLSKFSGDNGVRVSKFLFGWFHSFYVPLYVKVKLSEYKTNYSGKVRCSKSLGEYGLNFIEDADFNPHFVIPLGADGHKVQYPCLYYIRKKYYDFKCCDVTGNPLYYLNDAGFKLKLCRLQGMLDYVVQDTKENLSYILDNDVNIKGFDYQYYRDLASDVDLNFYLSRYSVYSCIYEGRHYKSLSEFSLRFDCQYNDYISDYRYFLHSGVFLFDFEFNSISELVQQDSSLVPFSHHPAFNPYRTIFERLRHLNDVVGKIRSDNKKFQYAERAEYVKRFNAAHYDAKHI